MPAAWISAGVGLYDALSGPSGGSSSGSRNVYVPYGLRGADTGWQQNQAINQQQLQGFAGQVDPNLLAGYNQLSGIDYNPWLQASQQAGQQYGNLAGMFGQGGQQMLGQAGQSFGQMGALQQAGQGLYGEGQQVFNTAMDPQQALYDRMRQQVTDQSAATNSMYGLGSSGAGAGLQNQALSNFNIDWQNQQLGRQMQGMQAAGAGLQGMGQANQVAGQYGQLGGAQMQAGLGYYGQVPGFTQQSAGVPLQAQQQAYGQPFQNAMNYGQALQGAMSPYQSMQNMATQYMGYGSNAGYQSGNLGLQQQQFQNQQLGQLGSALGQVPWGQLGGMFSNQNNPYAGMGGGTGQGMYTDPSSGNVFNNPSAYTPG